MIEIDYIKKPSAPTLRAAIRKAIATGETCIRLTWGENQISIDLVESNPWYRSEWAGYGWIGRNSGQDMANELNNKAKQ